MEMGQNLILAFKNDVLFSKYQNPQNDRLQDADTRKENFLIFEVMRMTIV